LHEKFALQLLNRQANRQLQNYKTDEAITIHLINLIKQHYKKWKRKCKTQENDLLLGDLQLDILYGENDTNQQLILNLNQQIFFGETLKFPKASPLHAHDAMKTFSKTSQLLVIT